MEQAVDVRNLTVKLSDFLVLDNVNICINRGEFVCFTGPSGCGKSTLIRAICGFVTPTSGSISACGKEVRGPSPERTMVFQEDSTFPWLTVSENVEFGLKVAGIKKKERREAAKRYLDMVHMGAFGDRYVRKLSVGQRQRVAIARGLVLEPDMLLMDEPFSALDVKTKNGLMIELHDIWKKTGQTILFVTHDPLEAATLGTRIVRFSTCPEGIADDFQNKLPFPRNVGDKKVVTLATKIKRDIISHGEGK